MKVNSWFGSALRGHSMASEDANTIKQQMLRDLYYDMISSFGWISFWISGFLNLFINIDLFKNVFYEHRYPEVTYWINTFSFIVNVFVVGWMFRKRREIIAVFTMVVCSQCLLLVQIYIMGRFDIFILSFLPMLVPAITLRVFPVVMTWLCFCTVFVLEVWFSPHLHLSNYATSWRADLFAFVFIPTTVVIGSSAIGSAVRRVQARFIDAVLARDQEQIRRVRAEADAEAMQERQRFLKALAQSEERNRIASEMHDGVSFHLNMAGRFLSNARNLQSEDSGLDLSELFDIAEKEIKLAQSELMIAVNAMHTVDIIDRPLSVAISELIPKTQALGIDMSYEVVGEEVSLRAEVVHELYRIVQEAINNIHKHAQAENAKIILLYKPQSVHLQITDDGIGLVRDNKDGHGLRNIEERVSARLGGRLDIEVDGGTTLWITIPI